MSYWSSLRDIRGYAPAAGDLAYPDKLLVTADILEKDKSHSDSDSVFGASGTEVCGIQSTPTNPLQLLVVELCSQLQPQMKPVKML